MQKIMMLLVSCLMTSTSMAANLYLDGFTREELINRLTSHVPIKDNIYSCSQVVYNYSLSQQAVKSCGFSRLSSAADTGNVMCHSWASLKSNGSFVQIRAAAKEAEKDFNSNYLSSQKKDAMCSTILSKYSDFIIE